MPLFVQWRARGKNANRRRPLNNASIQHKKGDQYVVENPFSAYILMTWRAPFTGGSQKVLPAGLRFDVIHDPPELATAVAASPEPYEEWQSVLVDADDLNAPKYNGYYLVVSFLSLEQFCRRLSTP